MEAGSFRYRGSRGDELYVLLYREGIFGGNGDPCSIFGTCLGRALFRLYHEIRKNRSHNNRVARSRVVWLQSSCDRRVMEYHFFEGMGSCDRPSLGFYVCVSGDRDKAIVEALFCLDDAHLYVRFCCALLDVY